MSTTRFALASLTALAATAGAIVAPSAASAATPTITQAASVRSCTNLTSINCAPFTTVASGNQLTMVCWRDESWATGDYSSNRWFVGTPLHLESLPTDRPSRVERRSPRRRAR